MRKDNGRAGTAKKIATKNNQALDLLGSLIEYVDDVDAILKSVAEHYDADRAYVFEFSEDRKTLDNTYEWCREGIDPQIDNLQQIPYESVELWVKEFERVGAFYITSLGTDVEANSLTYEILEPQGIESLITAPIYRDENIIGFIGVDNPRLNTDNILMLKTTASILYSEISRKISSKNRIILEMTEKQMRHAEELSDVHELFASANMGIWKIEIIENEEPRLYADETMKKLLGIDGKDVSPEKAYDEWFYNITPEAVPSVLNSVERMEQGHFDENTYLWKHPTKGVRYVRCGGIAKAVPGGYTLKGFHYDVDEVVRKDQAQMLKLKKALEEKKSYFDTLSALGDIFYSMHVIDLLNDTADEFNAKNEVKEIANHRDGAADMMNKIMNTVIAEECRERALEFTDFSTLADRMQNKMVISLELIGKNIGWFLASFITMEKDENGRPTKVIFVTRVIDEEIKLKENLIYKTQTDEMTGLYNRRAYEETIYAHNDQPSEDKFIYVSIDANGLKLINDTLGHAAGDEMLIGVAQCMKISMGNCGKLYRIGGDEFVAILFCDEQEVKEVLANFDHLLATWTGKVAKKLSVSYGWVDKYEMPGASTRELGAVAEKRMYEAKSDYYRLHGVDRRGQQDAQRVLCSLCTKILKINITEDTYRIISMDTSEQEEEKGFSDSISTWLTSFGKKGFVHPDDLEEYFRLTDLQYMRDYFKSGNTLLHVFYRRKYGEVFKRTMLEIVPANDYLEDNMSLFLYVKCIEK